MNACGLAMTLCSAIGTLAMAYLDDELAAEERRELELHLLTCASCKQQVDRQRRELGRIRRVLATPPALGSQRVSIERVLDAEDRKAARAHRRRVLTWLLPLAAATWLLMFGIAERPTSRSSSAPLVHDALRDDASSMQLDVRGPSTGPWLRTQFGVPIEPPPFSEPQITLLGARRTSVGGHHAAVVRYLVTIGQDQFTLDALVMARPRSNEISGAQPIRYGDGTLHVHAIKLGD